MVKPKKLREQKKTAEEFAAPYQKYVDDSAHYLARSVDNAIKWKLVRTYDQNHEGWYPDWMVKGVPHYLVFVFQDYFNKEKHTIICKGLDDTMMARRI